MSSITKARGLMGFAIAAMTAMLDPSKLMRSRTILDANDAKRARKAAGPRLVRGNKPRSSSFRDKHRGMIWVGGKWLFFRP